MNKNIETKEQKTATVQETAEKKDCCRAASESGAVFCPICGQRLAAEQMPLQEKPNAVESEQASSKDIAASQIKCGCGETLDPAAKFCCSCGNSVVPASAKVQQEEAAETNSGQTAFICACGEQNDPKAKFCFSCGNKLVSSKPRYRLVCKSTDGYEKTAEIISDVFVIGKNTDCDLAITHDECVSRRHAKLTVADGRVLLEDTGSLNGTFIQLTGPMPLSAGDTILIGANYLTLEEI